MPFETINGAKIYYEIEGEGNECIVFAHGLLFSLRMFDAQVAQLRQNYRCLRFDFRGQGRSEITPNGYDMDTLTEDALQLMERLDATPCHFVGLSMGGFVGMRLALRHPDILRTLTLMNTSADSEPPENIPKYRLLSLVARWLGVRMVVNRVMPILFGETFLAAADRRSDREYWKAALCANRRVAIPRALGGVIHRDAMADHIGQIVLPTLILAGEKDIATVPAKSEKLHRLIPGSRLTVIPRAGHSSAIEEPRAVTEAFSRFLTSVSQM